MDATVLLHRAAMRWRDCPAVAIGGHTLATFAELNDRAGRLASAFVGRLGLAPGDRIAIAMTNAPAYLEILFGAWYAGLAAVPMNAKLHPREFTYILENSGSRACFASPDLASAISAIAGEAPGVEHWIEVGGAEYERLFDGEAMDPVGAAPDDLAWLFYTSGTTGRPKGAILTPGQLAFVVNNHIADLMPGLAPDHASLVVAPVSHGAGVHALAQVAKGAVSVITDGPGFDEAHCWQLVEEHRIANMFTVPTILTRLVRHPSVDQHDHSSLRHVIYAGAPMYREDQRFALEKLGKVIVQYYGLGEVTGNITVLPAEEHHLEDAEMRIGSCGFPRTGMELAIKDPEGRRLQAGEVGEICVRGPAVFAGYLENPEANAKALKEGWFHSGDLGRLDEAGYLWITGRASDMYISGGANVYPREAEELLLNIPLEIGRGNLGKSLCFFVRDRSDRDGFG